MEIIIVTFMLFTMMICCSLTGYYLGKKAVYKEKLDLVVALNKSEGEKFDMWLKLIESDGKLEERNNHADR